MKKLLLVFALAIVAGMSFTACDKDEDGTPLIVGEWKPIKLEYMLANGEITYTIQEEEPDCSFMKFTENGAFELVDECGYWFNSWGTSGMTGNYTANGIFLTLKGSSPNNPEELNFSYTVTSDMLKITYTPEGEFGMDDDVYSAFFTFKRK